MGVCGLSSFSNVVLDSQPQTDIAWLSSLLIKRVELLCFHRLPPLCVVVLYHPEIVFISAQNSLILLFCSLYFLSLLYSSLASVRQTLNFLMHTLQPFTDTFLKAVSSSFICLVWGKTKPTSKRTRVLTHNSDQ